MSVKTTTVYNCDYCQKQLPDDYATTNGEGKGYYVKKAHDTIPLDTPIAGCIQWYRGRSDIRNPEGRPPLYRPLRRLPP